MSEAVSLKEVSKSYGEIQAVKDLNLNIPTGIVYGLLGPNGSGKSTTMKMMLSLVKPDSGSISIYGVDPQKDPLAVKRMIGYVPETLRLYEFLTSWEYLEFLCVIHGLNPSEEEPRIKEFFEAFELKGHENEMMGGYSHGMKQKIAIISALLGKPKLLILDEPLSGLDPKSAKIVKDLLTELSKEGVTTIFSTHVMEIADAICDKIGILYNGKKIVEATPAEIKKMANVPGSSLEQVFLEITGSSELKPIVDALIGKSDKH
ncbi:ABC transporter ATP-binding protein [Candidatus Bathyarchaeota archaeon]|nr:ABC transporter ATP-binding protein [Candidatus Bathyarchaeota archaeon]